MYTSSIPKFIYLSILGFTRVHPLALAGALFARGALRQRSRAGGPLWKDARRARGGPD